MKRTLAFLLLFASVHLIAQNEFISRNEFFKIRKGIVLVLPAEGGTIDLDSPTNGSWTALSDQSWLSVSPNAGTTYSLVKVTAVPNNSNLERNANVVFKTSSETVSVKIKQEGINEGTGSLSKTVNCTAGGLSSLLTAEELSTVTDLTITGTIDARDFKTMRDNMPLLAVLNISTVSIAEYTGTQGTCGGNIYTYPVNTIPDCSFGSSGTSTGKESLKTINLPVSITSIGMDAFANCINLNGSLTIPSNVKYIGQSAFENCPNFTGSLNLPEGLKTIDDRAFLNCENFSGTLKIPSTVDTIFSFAFRNCIGFSKLILSENTKEIQESAFEGCLNLDGKLIIPANTKKIKFRAFRDTRSLDSIIIHSNLDSIETLSFWGTGGYFLVDANNKSYSSLDGVLYNRMKNRLICCPTSIEGSFYIPLTIDTLSMGAFINCDKISSIRISSNVSVISSGAFAFCSTLKNVYVYSGIPAKLISDSFYGVNLSECTLHVPKNSKEVYNGTNIWMNFTNIVEDDDIAISRSSLLTSSQSGNYIITIYTNSNWTASSNQPWLTVSPTSGTGNTTITLTAEENSTTAERTAIVTVSASGLPSQTITVKQAGETTGIEDLTSNPISVYPNPTTHIFAVNGFDGIATVEIFNITGELKMKYTTEANRSISVGNLTKGLYVLKISTTSGVVSKKLVIE